ncbi:hypothetical protein [Marinomonas mediterranea]|uniref:hypothetical protein n=1 Tax=Marinomonas mediterranea TaxID=119864 RepID=UPI00234B8728|nr:hypothetical protein [Marinomonas mediterranea]WCN07899.1 hypothetical protein GV055_02620 [Marinomonas mediterranea]WCN11994.1 hypothetical protein GV054_02630 [Marinomonas mediterranea]
MFRAFRIRFSTLAVLSIILTACGGGGGDDSTNSSSSNNESGTGFTGTTAFSDSLVSGKRFYDVYIEEGEAEPYGIATILFDNSHVKVGDGYIESSENEKYFIEQYTWDVLDNGNLLVTSTDSDESLVGKVLSAHTDYIEVCFEESGETGNCDKELLFSDKAKAKAYIASNSPVGTSINLNSITDSALNAAFRDLEYDYVEQVYEIDLPKFDIQSLAGLNQFMELYRLVVPENHITDISSLSALTKMEILDLADQTDASTGDDINLLSYDAIYSMKGLVYLALTQLGNNVTPTKFELDTFLAASTAKNDIEVLAFYKLALDNDDVSAINSLPNLRVLAIDEGEVSDFSSWNNNWSKLQQLRVGWNTDSSNTKVTFDLNTMISKSLNLDNLTKLELAKTSITEADLATIVSGVGSKLRYLDLRSTNIDSYSNLSNASMPNLERLKLRPLNYGNDAYDLSGTLPFTSSKLTKLYLEDGDISNFTISNFSSLTKLQISGSNVISESVNGFVSALNALSNFDTLVIRRDAKLSGVTVNCDDLVGLKSSISCTDT